MSNISVPAQKHAPPIVAEVISPMNHRPDLLCDMVDDTAKGGNVRSLAEAIEEEVGYYKSYFWSFT